MTVRSGGGWNRLSRSAKVLRKLYQVNYIKSRQRIKDVFHRRRFENDLPCALQKSLKGCCAQLPQFGAKRLHHLIQRYTEQIMSKERYPSTSSCQMGAIVYQFFIQPQCSIRVWMRPRSPSLLDTVLELYETLQHILK